MPVTQKQKENLAKILINVGCITFGGVVLGYFISNAEISLMGFVIGILSVFLCFFGAITTDK